MSKNIRMGVRHFGALLLCLRYWGVEWGRTFRIKEYILVIEHTAPPSVFQTCVSPNLSPCSVRQSGSWRVVLYVYYRQSRKRLGGFSSNHLIKFEDFSPNHLIMFVDYFSHAVSWLTHMVFQLDILLVASQKGHFRASTWGLFESFTRNSRSTFISN